MTVHLEGDASDIGALQQAVKAHLKLQGNVMVSPVGTLPNDGKVIEDLRAIQMSKATECRIFPVDKRAVLPITWTQTTGERV